MVRDNFRPLGWWLPRRFRRYRVIAKLHGRYYPTVITYAFFKPSIDGPLTSAVRLLYPDITLEVERC